MEHLFERSKSGKSILVFNIDKKREGLEMKRFAGIMVPVNVTKALKVLKGMKDIELIEVDEIPPQDKESTALKVLWLK